MSNAASRCLGPIAAGAAEADRPVQGLDDAGDRVAGRTRRERARPLPGGPFAGGDAAAEATQTAVATHHAPPTIRLTLTLGGICWERSSPASEVAVAVSPSQPCSVQM